ncbi:MAG: site-specific integrase [Pseudomonadota bacterium]
MKSRYLQAFLEKAEQNASMRTLYSYVHHLSMAAGVLYPERMSDGRLRWLQKTEARLRRLSEKSPKQRYNKLVAMEDLVYVAETALLEAPDLSPCSGFLSYRDGLFMLLGLAAPERLRALASLRLDQLDLEQGTIRFDPRQIKMKRERYWTLPQEVLDYLEEWIEVWRPQRARPGEVQVFVNKYGTDIETTSLSRAMSKLTYEKLGRPASPHLIRHAVATSMLSEAPDRPAIASLLLGHRSPRTREAYTQKAGSIKAGRFARECFELAGQAAAKEVRRETRARTTNLGHSNSAPLS